MPNEKPKLKVNTGPFKDVIVLGHSSVEERDAEAGKSGSTLEDADYSDLYRSTLPEIHGKAAPELEKLSGVKRGVNTEQTAKNQSRMKEGKVAKDVPESFVDYAARVKAQVDEAMWKQIEDSVRAIALATPIDASPSKRGGGATKANLEKADDIIARPTEACEAAVTKLLTTVPEFELDRDENGLPERTSLARLVGEFIAKQSVV